MQPTDEAPRREKPPLSHWALPIAVAVLFCTTALSLAFLSRERRQAQDLTAANRALSTSLGQVQQQLQSLTARLNTPPNPAETTAPPAPAQAQTPAPIEKPHPMVRPHLAKAHRPAPADPRWKKMQDQLSDQEKAIASTREEVEKARQDLEGQLTSTHNELSGSIARTHDELVALEKRGERTYFEFQLDRSKQFQRVGPVGLSLRKVDTKHRSFNLALMVEDQELQKKSVNLYEPVWITVSDRPQPVELVVNEIHKDQIKGYLSEPKYKKSELAATSAPERPKLQPAQQQ